MIEKREKKLIETKLKYDKMNEETKAQMIKRLQEIDERVRRNYS